MSIIFLKQWRRWRVGASASDIADGVANVLIRRGIAVAAPQKQAPLAAYTAKKK